MTRISHGPDFSRFLTAQISHGLNSCPPPVDVIVAPRTNSRREFKRVPVCDCSSQFSSAGVTRGINWAYRVPSGRCGARVASAFPRSAFPRFAFPRFHAIALPSLGEGVYHQARLPPSASTTKRVYHQACLPPSPSTTKPVYHQARLPPSPSTTKRVYLQARLPPSPSTTKPVYHQARLPPSASTTKPVYHQAHLPPSQSTTKPVYH